MGAEPIFARRNTLLDGTSDGSDGLKPDVSLTFAGSSNPAFPERIIRIFIRQLNLSYKRISDRALLSRGYLSDNRLTVARRLGKQQMVAAMR
jgi:hypothetical protein